MPVILSTGLISGTQSGEPYKLGPNNLCFYKLSLMGKGHKDIFYLAEMQGRESSKKDALYILNPYSLTHSMMLPGWYHWLY
jgi:hypothetical protein